MMFEHYFHRHEKQATPITTTVYSNILLVGFAFIPAYFIAYIYFFQEASLVFDHPIFYTMVLIACIAAAAFIAYVMWRCYISSGALFLKWFTLAFLSVVLLYTIRLGLFFPRTIQENLWWSMYGLIARLIMSVFLLIGLLTYYRPFDSLVVRSSRTLWVRWIITLIFISAVVAILIYTAIPYFSKVHKTIEGIVWVLFTVNTLIVFFRRTRSPLMNIFGISMAIFAFTSLAFILTITLWSHMWWLAHFLFIGGLLFLSYGIIQAFHVTRSFSMLYSEEELITQLSHTSARMESALAELQQTNLKLQRLATTDHLTGASNRRLFVEQVEMEIARAKRAGFSFSLVSVDFDHFKQINDNHGHQAGDKVLQQFVHSCSKTMRSHDIIARFGGDEFVILLPQTTREAAHDMAQRIQLASTKVLTALLSSGFPVTVSMGIAEYRRDGDTINALLATADKRLYLAKNTRDGCIVSAWL